MTVDDEDEGLEVAAAAAVSASRVALMRWQWLLLSSTPIFILSLVDFGERKKDCSGGGVVET